MGISEEIYNQSIKDITIKKDKVEFRTKFRTKTKNCSSKTPLKNLKRRNIYNSYL